MSASIDLGEEVLLRRLPFDFSELHYVPGKSERFLLEEGNRHLAEERILHVSDILRAAHQEDERVPLLRIYSDDIRFEYQEGMDAAMVCSMTPMLRNRRPRSTDTVLRLHFCIIPDRRCKITGDFYFCADGEIDRVNVYLNRERDFFFIQCCSDGRQFVLNNLAYEEKKRRWRMPLIICRPRQVLLLCVTALLISGCILYTWSGVQRQKLEQSVVQAASLVTSGETAPRVPETEGQTSAEVIAESEPEPVTESAAESATEPATETTAEVDLPLPAPSSLSVAEWSKAVVRGQEAFVRVQGTPGTEYAIVVMFSSGASRAKGLEPLSADDSGTAEWHFKVSSRTKPGVYTITVSGGGESAEVEFTVLESP